MCTGAELPLAAAAMAGTGTAAAGAEAGAGTAASLGALSALAGAGEGGTSGLLGEAGLTAAHSIAPELAPALSMAEAGGGAAELAGAPGAANPLSIGLGNFQTSALGQGLGKVGDAANMYSKAQGAMGMGPKQTSSVSSSAPPSMKNNAHQTPFAARPIGTPGPMGGGGAIGMSGLLGGGAPDDAQKMLLKRLGLLGGM